MALVSTPFIKVINHTKKIFFIFLPKAICKICFELKVPERPLTPESVTGNKQEVMCQW